MSFPTRDWLTKAAAQDLANQIQSYWAAQGKKVSMSVIMSGKKQNTPSNEEKPIYVVRSNMVNGSPR